jgi:hypothetical protein
MAKDRSAYRPPDEPDEIGAEGGKRPRDRRLVRKVKLAENERGGRALEKKVVPLNCRSDCRCDDCLAQLRIMFGLG